MKYDKSLINKYCEKFRSEYEEGNSNWHSYDRCRIAFLNSSEEDTAEAELNLYCFLANWGMMRNSILVNRGYIDDDTPNKLIKILLQYQKDGVEGALLQNPPNFKMLIELKGKIKEYFTDNTYYVRDKKENILVKKSGASITDTLATKIMIGTLGCVPAYDRYVGIALKHLEIRTTFGENSLSDISTLVRENIDILSKVCENLNSNCSINSVYTPVKVLDSVLWLYGYSFDNNTSL